MVEPTKLKPRIFRSLLIASDSSLHARAGLDDARRFGIGLPPTNCQMYVSNEPNSFCTSRYDFAFAIADAIFRRLRTMPGFFSNCCCLRVVYRATVLGSKLSNA